MNTATQTSTPTTQTMTLDTVGHAVPHESAHLHVAGAAPYTDDIPETAGTLHCALGLSPVPHGRLLGIDVARLRAQPGVVDVLTAADIPGLNDFGALVHDDPILAADIVQCVGQPVFAIIATRRDLARRAAALAREVLTIEPLPFVLTGKQAHAQQQYVAPPMHLTRGDPAGALAAAPHRLQGEFAVGGQEQFYLEGQIAYALPQEGGALRVYSSTQHPSEIQHAVAHALGLGAHDVQVICRRMGGGFGGKESQPALFACVAAVAALRLGRPVKLRPDRDDDMQITGKRHPFDYRYDVGFDAAGRILGVELEMIATCGYSADLSAPVMTRAICHFDNTYWLPHVAMHGYCARTHTQSNTAFRGFGGPQGALAIEHVMEAVAAHLGLDPLDVRQANFYGPSPAEGHAGERNVTPYGQVVEDNIIHALVDELVRSSDYRARRVEIARFNAHSPVLKRGISLTPLKFGISFNVVHLNQAGALVHVYSDGTVLVNHGGTEMGQGLNIKVAQVVAEELGIPLARVRVSATDTQKIANTSATAASTGSDLNGKAAQAAARTVRERLAHLAAQRWSIDASGIEFRLGQVYGGTNTMRFDDLVSAAYLARVQLWSDGFYATPGLHWDRERLQGKPFYYFSYGAAVSEVERDSLTGEWRLVRADLLQDVGASLNPAIDIGQVEGAYVQGMGWLLLEDLQWHPERGHLLNHAPSTYKIPTANDLPPDWRVALWSGQNPADTIHSSKAVGEPPLLLGISALMAARLAANA